MMRFSWVLLLVWLACVVNSGSIGEECRRKPAVIVDSHTLQSSAVHLSEACTYLMYFTNNIELFSTFSFSTNYLHGVLKGCSIIRVVPDPQLELDRNDNRWNKVILLHSAIQNSLNSTNGNLGSRYVVWLDSDLFVANYSFSFQSLLDGHPDKNLIISEEINPLNGIANSGCMIFRVNEWSLSFLWRWWTVQDRTLGMDQHVLDQLFSTEFFTGLKIRDNVALLSPTAINSAFPGLVSHRVSHPILHLAGESNFIRGSILQRSWEELCSSQYSKPDMCESDIGDDVEVWPPCGISRRSLDSVDYIALHKAEWEEIHASSNILATTASATELSDVSSLRYRIREAQQSLSKFLCEYYPGSSDRIARQQLHDFAVEDHSCTSLKDMFYHDAVRALRVVYIMLSGYSKPSMTVQERLEHLQSTVDAAMELLTVLHPSSSCTQSVDLVVDSAEVINQAQSAVEAMSHILQVSTLESQRELQSQRSSPVHRQGGVLAYYAFKLAEFSAVFVSTCSPNNLQVWEDALQKWMFMVEHYQYFGTGNGVMRNYHEGLVIILQLAIKYCEATLSSTVYRHRGLELLSLAEKYLNAQSQSEGTNQFSDPGYTEAVRVCSQSRTTSVQTEADTTATTSSTGRKKFKKKSKPHVEQTL